MDVLHILSQLSPGGGCVSPFEFASLANQQIENASHHFLILDRKSKYQYKPPRNVPYQLAWRGNARLIADRILQLSPDIVHFHWWKRNSLMFDVMMALRGDHSHLRILTCDVFPAEEMFRLTPEEIEYADVIVFDGQDSLAAYPEIPAAKKVFAVGGTDLGQYYMQPRIKQSGRFRIARGSTLSPFKCPPDLIQMVLPLIEQAPTLDFHIFGEGELAGHFRREIARHQVEDRIFLRGWIQHFPRELAQFDAYLYHLPQKSFASSELNIQGAMAVGLPIVVMPSGGTQWMFHHQLDSLVAANPNEAVAHMLDIYASADLRNQLSIGARAKASGEFGTQNMLGAYMRDVYSKATVRRDGLVKPGKRSLLQSFWSSLNF